ncbi:MAG: twin-arginine translocase TatA/TatE family subunit [Bdellovibrionales bacterium]|nr:twin-arginine translocase TatA/TatE family subunit [Bdellovibrionales bacterium]
MFGLGPWELIVILVIVIIVFGVGKLPELGTGLGEGIKNFKKAYRDAKTLDVTPEQERDTGSDEKRSDEKKS